MTLALVQVPEGVRPSNLVLVSTDPHEPLAVAPLFVGDPADIICTAFKLAQESDPDVRETAVCRRRRAGGRWSGR